VPDRKRSQGAEPRHSNTNLSRFFTTGKQFSVGSVTVARSSQSKPVLFFMRRSKQASPFRTEVLVFFSSIGQPVGNSTTLTALIRGILDRSTEMKGCVRARKQERHLSRTERKKGEYQYPDYHVPNSLSLNPNYLFKRNEISIYPKLGTEATKLGTAARKHGSPTLLSKRGREAFDQSNVLF